MRKRKTQEEIHNTGFNMLNAETPITRTDYIQTYGNEENAERAYSKVKVNLKTIEDAVLDLGTYRKTNSRVADKSYVLRAINNGDLNTMREISDAFYELSGMYQRFCKYLAEIYRYDWYVTIHTDDGAKEPKLIKSYEKILQYFDRSEIRRMLNNVALQVMKHGVYYAIIVDLKNRFTLQELPPQYCRSRLKSGLDPVVELNLRFFDDYFPNIEQKLKMLSIFPKDVQRGYMLFKQNKLKPSYPGDENCWWIIDCAIGVKFNLNGSDAPPLINVIPYLIDLDDAQDLDRKKVMQQLLKIIIQKLPFDKNGDLIFDVDEAKDVHNNAVRMLSGHAVGVDVLTTFTDVEVADMADKNSATTTDDLQRVERAAFNATGSSQNLFNTEGNIALEKSVLNDEAYMKDLLYQFRSLLNRVAHTFDASKWSFSAEILETSIYNYMDLSKMYKEHVQIGYSKMLPQIALGHSQSSIVAAAKFENNILHLSDVMIPPLSSNTMSGKGMAALREQSNGTSDVSDGGRPEKDNDEKSEKTIANRAAMGKE